jgi:hypothetical protein
MQKHERSGDREAATAGHGSDRWAEVVLGLACLLTLAWIAFTLWLAAEVLGLV